MLLAERYMDKRQYIERTLPSSKKGQDWKLMLSPKLITCIFCLMSIMVCCLKNQTSKRKTVTTSAY